jgi:LuxR family transcriptional regulator, positive regulator of biofilm formation
MTILIDLGNGLVAEALSQLLVRAGYDHVVRRDWAPAPGLLPDVLLVDDTTLRHELLARYPEAKVLLVDSGTEPEKLLATLLSYRIHGVLSLHAEPHLLQKALTALAEGQIWTDNGSVKTPHSESDTRTGQTSRITDRQQEIIACICQGLSDKQIAERLALSPHTVGAHLNRIYCKLGVTSRSKLIALTLDRLPARSA